MNDQVLSILLCYSDKDRDMVDNLKAHLSPLEVCNLITLWDQSNIIPGAHKEQEMDKHFAEAQVILLLISASFLAEYWYNVVLRAIERHERKEAHVIPVILYDVIWEITPLKKLKPLPDDGKSIADWESQGVPGKGYKRVAVGIFKVVEAQKAFSLPDERKTLKANLDQLIETITLQIGPPYRAEALVYTLQQLRMIIPNDVTLADLVVGWRTLSYTSKQEKEQAIKDRRGTCRELANLASQFTTDQGNLLQAIKTWRIWAAAFKKGVGDKRQAAMAKTFRRELKELKKAAATH